MKKKFDLKLTACLVSLFISFLLIIFFNDIPGVLALSFVIMAVVLYFLAKIRIEKIDLTLENTEIDIDQQKKLGEIDDEDLEEVYKQMAQLTKQKKSIKFVFNAAAIMLLVVALLIIL